MANEFVLPDIGEGLTEVEIVQWLAEVGTQVALDAPLVEVETDKAITEIPSPYSGTLLHRGAAEGERLNVGEILAVVGIPGESWEPAGTAAAIEPAPIIGTLPEARSDSGRVAALPAVRKLARDLGVNMEAVTGSGPEGRVTREDVMAASAAGPQERVRLTPVRRAIAERLSRSWREIPHVTTFGAADAMRILAARSLPDGSVPLEALLISALVPLLVQHPEFNAALIGEELVLKHYYNIGVATATSEGLMLPVVRAADALTISQLAGRIADLGKAARERKLQPDDLADPTFSLSNIGAVGGTYGTPIIPHGTTAILSVGRAEEQAVVRDGTIIAVSRLPLSLSYDHRVIDGALGRQFLAATVDQLETLPFLDS